MAIELQNGDNNRSLQEHAYEILYEVLSGASKDVPTEFMTSNGKILTQTEVTNAVALAYQHHLLTIFAGDTIELDAPLKVMEYRPQNKFGLMFDSKFLSGATPKLVQEYLDSNKIDAWKVTKILFRHIRDQLIFE